MKDLFKKKRYLTALGEAGAAYVYHHELAERVSQAIRMNSNKAL